MNKRKTLTPKIYGAYGSNLNLEQMSFRCPDAVKLCTGFVNDYKLTFRRGGYANIEPSVGSRVPVLLWEVSVADEVTLDRYEGFPRFYVKRDIEVQTESRAIAAMFYVMNDCYAQQSFLPTLRYYDTVRDGYFDNNLPLRFLRRAVNETKIDLCE